MMERTSEQAMQLFALWRTLSTGNVVGQNRKRDVTKSQNQAMLATSVPKRPRLKSVCRNVLRAVVPRSMSGTQYDIW